MKKTLALLTIVGLAASVYGQGILLQNIGNNGAFGAASKGLVYMDGVIFDGATFNLGVEVLAGPDAGSLSPLGTFTALNDPKGYTGFDPGKFLLGALGATVNPTGVSAGGTALVQLNMWFDGAGGLFPSYAAAYGVGYTATATFANPTGNPGAEPPVVPQELTGMPSMNMVIVPIPEPATFALLGLGALGLALIRRK